MDHAQAVQAPKGFQGPGSTRSHAGAIRTDRESFVKASNEPNGSWHRNTLSFVSRSNKPNGEKPIGFGVKSIAPAEGQGIRFEIRS
jgi:hypothetical protein